MPSDETVSPSLVIEIIQDVLTVSSSINAITLASASSKSLALSYPTPSIGRLRETLPVITVSSAVISV